MTTEEATKAPADVGQAPPSGEVAGWTDGFTDDMKGYIETKGFADAGSLAESYQNLEKLRGVPADQLLQLPTDMTNLEAMAPIYDKLGRPESAEGYTNVLGDGFDTDSFNAITGKAHELGLSDGQLQGMQEEISKLGQQMQEAQDAEAEAAFGAWKDSNPEGYQTAARVMATVGMDEQAIEGVLNGDKSAIYDMLAKVGARSSEGVVVQGEAPTTEGFGMTPAKATAKIGELWKDDAFKAQYLNGTGQVKADAIERMAKLHEIAASGKG